MPRRSFVILALAAALFVPSAARAAASPPAIFEVGTAVVDITPSAPQYLGGYDQMTAEEASNVTANDPLQVRAFFVSRGSDAVAFAIVDSQGWFAGYQEGSFGVTDARSDAAAKITTLGHATMTQANIIVSSTHSHAAPTLMGIWGPTDPVYLKRVHDATVEALFDAAQHTHYAQLWTGAGSISSIIAHTVEGTDHYDGWSIDAETPFLWARDPETLATIGMYVNVPVHADSYRGSKCSSMSADTPGVVRRILDSTLGGTAVVAMGTLGRQETIGPSDCGARGYDEVTRDGRYLANRIDAGLAQAEPITDGTLAGAETYVLTPGTNPALLALVYANTQGFQCVGDPVGACTIDRSVEAPYLIGNMIGTYVTSLRVGDNVWVSEPGEAFPEVSAAIRESVMGARAVHVVGMAQDQLGYYYPPEDYPSTEMNPSDFLIYNIGPLLADQNVQASAINATLLGFAGKPGHPVMGNDEPHRYNEPGVQFFPIVTESASNVVSFTGNAKASGAGGFFGDLDPLGVLPLSRTAARAQFDFGDGTSSLQPADEFDHTFPGPGTYTVSATTSDEQGQTRTFTQTVIVDAEPQATIAVDESGATDVLRAGIDGGDGNVIAAHWLFSNGDTADGLRVSHAPDPGLSVTVTIVDGAGDIASTTIAL